MLWLVLFNRPSHTKAIVINLLGAFFSTLAAKRDVRLTQNKLRNKMPLPCDEQHIN